MSPQYLPHFFFLLAGLFLVCLAFDRMTRLKWKSALKLGGVGLLLMGVAIVGGRYESWKASRTSSLPEFLRPRPLVPANPTAQAESTEEPDTMTLDLGGVRIRVPASDRYDLSASDETFLTVSSDSSGLLVTCRAAGASSSSSAEWPAARISENTVTYKAPDISTSRPDPHTILVMEDGAETLRVHYPEPRTLEVTGQLQLTKGVVRLERGIVWPPNNFIPPGPMDLTARGRGRIDLEPSGLIQVVSR